MEMLVVSRTALIETKLRWAKCVLQILTPNSVSVWLEEGPHSFLDTGNNCALTLTLTLEANVLGLGIKVKVSSGKKANARL